jgi:hypothetical protein
MPSNPPSSSLPDLRRLLSSPIIRCGPVTRNQPSSKGHVARFELTGVLHCRHSFAYCGCAALPLRALLLLACSGVNAREAQKVTWVDWARKLEKENGLSGPLNGSHITFFSFLFLF